MKYLFLLIILAGCNDRPPTEVRCYENGKEVLSGQGYIYQYKGTYKVYIGNKKIVPAATWTCEQTDLVLAP